MRHSPIAALGFLIGLVLIPMALTYGTAWGALRMTNSAVLFYRSEVPTQTASDHASEEATRILCRFFTGTGVIDREYGHNDLGYDDVGLFRRGSCPWRIEAS